ncbi:hypothetical protein ARHIZOSPH14_06920 [Agromyces rhizosphaerae]|uniref:Uncharacterized protein n=1 Tax=Agromyces rhizosphaerae TaxID=88374 RepID=A0A9W6CVH7_9MICO|nr:hypothetical protein ARHIZOSPH14_06920 [Agromyces rhizosphaerae]
MELSLIASPSWWWQGAGPPRRVDVGVVVIAELTYNQVSKFCNAAEIILRDGACVDSPTQVFAVEEVLHD